MKREIDNTQDIMDSRDIIERIEELEYDQSELFTEGKELDEDEAKELKILKELEDECNYGDWAYGETLIRETYFKEYAQDLAEDCCEMPKEYSWPHSCIDWDQAARDLQMDYSAVEFDGVTYYIRS